MSDLGNRQIMAENILYYMELNRVSKSDVCRALGFKMPTFSDWIHAKTYPRIDKIEAMANYFGINKSDLVERRHSLPAGFMSIDFSKYHSIPILGRISAGLPLYAEEHIEGYTLTDLNGGAEYFALKVKGDSMDAIGIKEGHLIIVRRQEEVETGEVAVVMVGDDDATVKRFYSSGDIVTLMPQSTNPIHTPQIYDPAKTAIKILGKVVEVKFTL